MANMDAVMQAKKTAFDAIVDFKAFYDKVIEAVKKDKTKNKIVTYRYEATDPLKGLTEVEQVMLAEFVSLVSYFNGWHVKLEFNDQYKPTAAVLNVSGAVLRDGPTTPAEFRKQFDIFNIYKQFNFTVQSGY